MMIFSFTKSAHQLTEYFLGRAQVTSQVNQWAAQQAQAQGSQQLANSASIWQGNHFCFSAANMQYVTMKDFWDLVKTVQALQRSTKSLEVQILAYNMCWGCQNSNKTGRKLSCF